MADFSIPPRTTASRTAFVIVGVLAAQIPSTLQEVSNPMARGALQLVAVLLIFGIGWLMQPPATAPARAGRPSEPPREM